MAPFVLPNRMKEIRDFFKQVQGIRIGRSGPLAPACSGFKTSRTIFGGIKKKQAYHTEILNMDELRKQVFGKSRKNDKIGIRWGQTRVQIRQLL